ncbi:MAG: TlpA family protein disulfide reductase [Hyphomicrobium sp.]|nr:TlpA family protein disulfide reductase [Hyphomicrobium sp.]
MTDDNGRGPAASRIGLIGTALAAAAIGFAAVYVTQGGPDNDKVTPGAASAPAAEAAVETKDGAGGGDLVAFVRKNPPVDMAEISFEDEAGAKKTLADFKGKVILLNLWATWCVPCRHEMPSLDRLQKEMGSDQFEVVALSLDRAGRDAARKFFDEIKVQNLKLYIDQTMKAGNGLRAVGMPTTILIGKDGKELGRLPGPAEWDSEAAKKLVAEALK